MVSAGEELIDVLGIGARGGILAQDRKIGGDLAVKKGELLHFRAGEASQAGRTGFGEKSLETVPHGPTPCKPLIGEDGSHERGF